MGGSCYTNNQRDLLVVGNYCENDCFPRHGGCASAVSVMEKPSEMCELRPTMPDKIITKALEKINTLIEKSTKKGNSVFLYTPNMFSDFYFKKVLSKLPNRNGNTYLAINGCVRSFVDKTKLDWKSLHEKGIREIWLGVESGNVKLRDIYNKPKFTNEEIVRITKEGRNNKINVCWFLVDGEEDTDKTRLETYSLMKEAQPFRFHFSPIENYNYT